MHFLNPMMFWAAPLVPLGAIMVWLAWRRKKQLQDYFGEQPLVERFSKPLRKEAYQFKALWVMLALSAFIIALARPALENGTDDFPMGSVDVVTIVDVSRSMAAQDYKGKIPGQYFGGGTRLDMARYLIINDVIPSLRNNRLGVVTFAGHAFPQAFLTTDMQALGFVLGTDHSVPHAMTISSAPGEGSALVEAFGLAFKYYDLDSEPQRRKIIVLFSDGGNDDGPDGLNKIIAECNQRGIEVVVAGLGSTEPVPIPVKQLSPQDQARQGDNQWFTEDGEIPKTALDENTLRYLANSTGGRYVKVSSPSDFHIGSLFGHVIVIHHKAEQELFMYPLSVALFFMVLALITPMERSKADLPAGSTSPGSGNLRR